MLVDAEHEWALARRVDEVIPALTPELAAHVSAETQNSVLELASSPHHSAGDAAAQARELRTQLAAQLNPMGLWAAAAGTHPLAVWTDTRISGGERHQTVYDLMRELARREPTFGLHVHVGVADPESAVTLYNRLRIHLPLLLALSANSPYWQGRDSGLSSARTPIFQAFPRVGVPRPFGSYEEYVEAIDLLLRCEAIPEPTYLWWDVRLQPRFGTVEIRIMDVQSSPEFTHALVGLVQTIAHLELEEGFHVSPLAGQNEVLIENRFSASRDGMHAMLIDPLTETRVRADKVMTALLEVGPAPRPAARLRVRARHGCRARGSNGAQRQRTNLRGDRESGRRRRRPGPRVPLAAAAGTGARARGPRRRRMAKCDFLHVVNIRAAVLEEIGQPPTITTLELDAPGPGEVLVRVRAAGLCHSDLSVIDGSRPRPVPMVLGHEIAGEVTALGPDVTGLSVGDHVVASFVPACGSCGHCRGGRPALCEPGAAANTAGVLLGGERRLHRGEGAVHHHLGRVGVRRARCRQRALAGLHRCGAALGDRGAVRLRRADRRRSRGQRGAACVPARASPCSGSAGSACPPCWARWRRERGPSWRSTESRKSSSWPESWAPPTP